MDSLKIILARVRDWPIAAQQQLADIILEMDGVVRAGGYAVSADELRAFDEADSSGVATAEEVAASFRAFNPSS